MATILVVDDHPTNREFLVTLLGYRGHRLPQAADGAEALQVARAAHPDLIISDILMPTMDGYELVRQLRADPDLGHLQMILSTAHYPRRTRRARWPINVVCRLSCLNPLSLKQSSTWSMRPWA